MQCLVTCEMGHSTLEIEMKFRFSWLAIVSVYYKYKNSSKTYTNVDKKENMIIVSCQKSLYVRYAYNILIGNTGIQCSRLNAMQESASGLPNIPSRIWDLRSDGLLL